MYKRPFLDMFLDYVCTFFEVVVFTAGEKLYADSILNVLDPKGRISRRLYKEQCILCDGSYVKPIRVVSNNVASSIIIENNPECYQFDKRIVFLPSLIISR